MQGAGVQIGMTTIANGLSWNVSIQRSSSEFQSCHHASLFLAIRWIAVIWLADCEQQNQQSTYFVTLTSTWKSCNYTRRLTTDNKHMNNYFYPSQFAWHNHSNNMFLFSFNSHFISQLTKIVTRWHIYEIYLLSLHLVRKFEMFLLDLCVRWYLRNQRHARRHCHPSMTSTTVK